MIGLHSAQITLDNIQVTLIQVTPVPVTPVLALTLIQVTLKVKPQHRCRTTQSSMWLSRGRAELL